MSLTDTQVDVIWKKLLLEEGCQAGIDPVLCGVPVARGKSYCSHHYGLFNQAGSSTNSRRKKKELDRELAGMEQAEADRTVDKEEMEYV